MLSKKLVELAANLSKRLSYGRLRYYQDDPRAIQERILRRILKENRDTTFGREHRFAEIKSYEDYRARVPIRTSAMYLDYLQRVYRGERNVITREDPYYFAMTTGSTGDYMYIPITVSSRKEVSRSILAFMHLLEKSYPVIQRHSVQFLVGNGDGGHSPAGVPQGFVSGFNYKNLPKAITRRFLIPYWVFTLSNPHDCYYAMARFMIDADDLVAIGAISPLKIINVAKSILANSGKLAADLRQQSLSLSPENQSRTHGLRFRLQPEKLAALEDFSERLRQGEDPCPVALMGVLFNRLQIFVTWSGGNMSYSLMELQRYFGKKDLYEMPFSASEGTFSVPHQANAKGGIAAITGHFLEFIPEDQIDLDRPEVLPVWALEQGKTYYQVVSTMGGMYRYNMEDLVLISGFEGKVPVLEFLSKRARQVSINNERITEKDVTDVTSAVCSRLGVRFDHFIFFPTQERFYRLVLDRDLPNMQEFLGEVEAELRRISMGYNWERAGLSLLPLRASVVDRDALAAYVRSRQFKSNLLSGQFKPIHLSNVFNGDQEFPVVKEYKLEDACNGQTIEA